MSLPSVFVRNLGRVRYGEALAEQLTRFDVKVEGVRGQDGLRKFFTEQLDKSRIYDSLTLVHFGPFLGCKNHVCSLLYLIEAASSFSFYRTG